MLNLVNFMHKSKLLFVCLFLSTLLVSPLFGEGNVLPLKDNWELYWNRFISSYPDESPDIITSIPNSWEEAIETITGTKSNHGYASYRKVISGLIPDKKYAILLSKSPSSASVLFVNGKELFKAGNISSSETECSPYVSPIYVHFYPDSKGNVELIFHVSNFLQKNGGLTDNVFFGRQESVYKYYILQNGIAWLVIGTLIILASLSILQFVLSPTRRENLYFAFLSLTLAIRVGVSGFSVFSISFASLSYSFFLRLEDFAMWGSPILLCSIIMSTSPKKNPALAKSIIIISVSLLILTIFYPISNTRFFDHIIQFSSVVACNILCVYLLFQIKSKDFTVIVNFLSFTILTVLLEFDFYFSNKPFVYPFNIYPLFFLTFAIFRFLTLAAQQSIMYSTQKKLVRTLKKANNVALAFVPKDFLNQIEKNNVNQVELGDCIEKKMTISYTSLIFNNSWNLDLSAEQEYILFSKAVTHISPIVKKHNGYISKIISQDIICLFPNHPSDAINCHIELAKELDDFIKSKENDSFTLNKFTGIHYGKLLLGTIGEKNRLDDTVVSENVNIVSRLSNVSKNLNVDFVFSDEVFSLISELRYDFSQLGISSIKGKSRPIPIYTCTKRISREKGVEK